MTKRFIFRQVDYRDFPTFLTDQELRSKNHQLPQKCHQTSYKEIVDRRGSTLLQLPHGGVINDYVPFYFSPFTSFACTIHRGGVDVFGPNGEQLGKSCAENRIFFVAEVCQQKFSSLDNCFSNVALNTEALSPQISNNLSLLQQHVNWLVFDDTPKVASISEIGYAGVCKYFHSVSHKPAYARRKEQRMAEFLVKDAIPLELITCIIAPNNDIKEIIEQNMLGTSWNIPVYTKPGCFVK